MRRRYRVSQVLAASTAILALTIGLRTSDANAAVAAPNCAGACAAVAPDTSGAAAAGRSAEIVMGQRAVYAKHIITGPDDQVLVRFLGRSSMLIGPNSDITIDEFVFDPNTGSERLALSAVHGVLRYSGSMISRSPEAVSIRTAVGTIGAHGGEFLLALAPNGHLNVVSLDRDGPTVTGQSGMPQILSRSVSLISIAGPGAAASSPIPLSAESWARLIAQATAETAVTRAVATAH
jgi:hypothetical protein